MNKTIELLLEELQEALKKYVNEWAKTMEV